MKGDFHVRFCENVGVKFPCVTRLCPIKTNKPMTFFKKLFGKNGKEHNEKITTQPLPTRLDLEALTDKEFDFVANNIGLTAELFKDFSIEGVDHQFEPECIGKAISMWYTRDLQADYDIDFNMYSNALSSAWGNYLEEKLGMEWQVITDEFGAEIGLYHKNNNVTVFPFNSTGKALKNNDPELLLTITHKLSEVIKNN